MRALNRQLNRLYRLTGTGPLARRNGVVARVTYFAVCTDTHHEACGRLGRYLTVTGRVGSVDPIRRTLRVGEAEVAFDDLLEIGL